jgi:hypothetical protein
VVLVVFMEDAQGEAVEIIMEEGAEICKVQAEVNKEIRLMIYTRAGASMP